MIGNNQGFAVQDLQRRFIDLPQHFDTFISERVRKNPSVMHDRFARGQYQYFSGLNQTINIFHGTAGEQAGLGNFRQIQLSRAPSGNDPGNDACGPFSSKTFDHGIESRTFTGYEGVWESPVICLSDLIYLHMGREQAAMVAKQLPTVVQSVWETWNREQALTFAVAAGNSYILNRNGIDLTANGPRFEYNAFDEKDFGDGQGAVPYVKFAAGTEIGGLDMSFFDWFHEYLSDECPEAALSSAAGVPVFGLVVHHRDIDDMVLANPKLREAYLYAKPEQLIDGYPLTFKNLRNWALISDLRQPRFSIVRTFTDDDGDVKHEAKRVLPRRYVATTNGSRQDANPEYVNAEFAIGLLLVNDAFSTLVPGNLPNLGNGMHFGPVAGLNAQFDWVNEYHETKNPHKEKGNYRARFRMFPRPGDFSRNLIAFLYSRTPHVFAGPQIRVGQDETAAVSTTLAVASVAGDFDTTNLTLNVALAAKLDLEGRGLPAQVLLTAADNTTYSGVLTESAAAPNYTIAFAANHVADVAKFTTDMTVELV